MELNEFRECQDFRVLDLGHRGQKRDGLGVGIWDRCEISLHEWECQWCHASRERHQYEDCHECLRVSRVCWVPEVLQCEDRRRSAVVCEGGCLSVAMFSTGAIATCRGAPALYAAHCTSLVPCTECRRVPSALYLSVMPRVPLRPNTLCRSRTTATEKCEAMSGAAWNTGRRGAVWQAARDSISVAVSSACPAAWGWVRWSRPWTELHNSIDGDGRACAAMLTALATCTCTLHNAHKRWCRRHKSCSIWSLIIPTKCGWFKFRREGGLLRPLFASVDLRKHKY